MFIEILFKMLLFKGGVLIYAEHCICLELFSILNRARSVHSFITGESNIM